MSTFPLFVDLAERLCLVVGGGRVARRKVASLLEAEAVVTVVSPSIEPSLDETLSPRLRLIRRPYRSADLDGVFLAVAATDDPTVNAQVVADARSRGILVGSVEAAGAADFTFGAVIRREDLTIGISTGGRSPAFSRWMRQEIERFLTPEYLGLLDLAAEIRSEGQRHGHSVDPTAWRDCFTPELLELIRRGQPNEARARITRMLAS